MIDHSNKRQSGQRQSVPGNFTPRRELGRTGFVATRLGIGDVADRQIPFETCVATVERALAAGLNLIDTAPMYEDGYSEEIVGAAIRACRGRREQIFLIDKIDFPEAPVAPQIEASLGRLQLERTDAFVFHALNSIDLCEQLLEPGGGFDQLYEAVQRGLTCFRGVSSHNPVVLQKVIESGNCDIVMFPVGPFVDHRYVEEILPLARRKGVGTVCFKTFGAGKLVGDTSGYNQPLQIRPRGKISSGGSNDGATILPRLSVADCLHYTMTLDPDVALLGLSFPNEQDEAFAAAVNFHPLDPLDDEVMADIRQRAAKARQSKGPCWWNPDPDA